jgi:hypothetical protein
MVVDLPGRFLEFVNGFLFIVCLGLIASYIGYVWRKYRRSGKWGDIDLGIALLLFVIGDATIREPVWYYRHLDNHGIPVSSAQISLFWFIVAIGTIIASVGGLLSIKLQSPYYMQPWSWLLTLVAAFGFAVGMSYF